jgi:hypothetical protein
MGMTTPFNTQSTVAPEVQIANQVKTQGNMLFKQMVFQYTKSYNDVWSNPLATPDKIVKELGTDAVKVFTLSAGLAAYLNAAGASVPAAMPTGWTYTANPDGSVTLVKS